jgi:hypothetical protein
LTYESQCNAIHKSIVEQFKQAIVYGKSVKHQPQRVGLSHELADEDISKRHGSVETPAKTDADNYPSYNYQTVITDLRPSEQQLRRKKNLHYSNEVWSRGLL